MTEYCEIEMEAVPKVTQALLDMGVGGSCLFQLEHEANLRSAATRLNRARNLGRKWTVRKDRNRAGVVVTCLYKTSR